MRVSNNVVIFALIGLAVVSVDFYLAHQQSDTPSHCQQIADNDSVFALTNMASIASQGSLNSSLSQSSMKNDAVNLKSTQLSNYSQCITQSDNSVSWMDWVFSWHDSPTFHYLDLLELLTSSGDSHGHAGQSSPIKS